MPFPKGFQAVPYPAPDKFNTVVLTTTQTWIAPAAPGGVIKAEVTVIDGGKGGAGNTGGSSTSYYPGSPGGNSGVSVLTLISGGVYTATIGAGSAAAATPAAPGATSFSGPGITTLTSANAVLRVPGGVGDPWGGSGPGSGGGTLYAPTGSTGYGAGGKGGNDASPVSGGNGQNGVVIISY
jgi:hypothetical protein